MSTLIQNAIKGKKSLVIKYLDLDFFVKIDPYIYGNDLFQQQFVWGWVHNSGVCYKFFTEMITDILETDEIFNIQSGVEYYYASEEEHFGFVEGIPNYTTFKS